MKILLKVGLIFVISLLLSTECWSSREKYSNELRGKPLSSGASFVVLDDKYEDALENAKIDISTGYEPKYENLVSVEIVEDGFDVKQSSTTYYVYLQIDLWYGSGSNLVHTTLTPEFHISYDTEGVNSTEYREYIKESGYRKMEVTILNIYDLNDPMAALPEMRIYGEIVADRKYNFQSSLGATGSNHPIFGEVSVLSSLNETMLDVNWESYEGAEAYDLEWTFYDKESEIGKKIANVGGVLSLSDKSMNDLFRNNASRVRIEKEHYQIPLLYPEGYVFYRLRGLRYDNEGFTEYSNWTTDPASGGDVVLSSWPDKRLVSWHEDKLLTWQSQVVYAEEGKHIPSISYYDGSMRSRQSVTYSHSIGHPIVSETIYDHHGRPALNVMPAPSSQEYIGFHDDWSVYEDVNGVVDYDKSHFDLSDCSFSPEEMDDNYGSSSYYSEKNFKLPDLQDPLYDYKIKAAGEVIYTPHAEGYPFSITEYTPDGSGRVKRQSGVGPQLQLGTGQESRYYYGKAYQQEIDRLFGNTIGHSSHYFKNMVIDPNGQVSVSYQDAHGRTIATGLAGSSPLMVSEVEGEGEASLIEKDLINNILGDGRLVSVSSLLVTDEQNHKFLYTILPFSSFKPSCYPSVSPCYDCAFDSKVTVTDNCGNEFNGGVPWEVLEVNNYTDPYNYDCTSPGPVFNNDGQKELPIGEYKVTRELVLNEGAVSAYLADFLSNGSCLPDYEDILQEITNELESDCEFSCEDCLAGIPSNSTLIGYFLEGIDSPTASEISSAEMKATETISVLESECEQMCSQPTECEMMAKMMEADMYPGGQYAKYDYDETGDVYTVSDVTSIFYNNRYQSLSYEDEAGMPYNVYYNGFYVNPSQLDIGAFISNWDPIWARKLVEYYHPEYCYLSWCEDNALSAEWDNSLYEIGSYDMALYDPVTNPDGVIDGAGNFLNDPFFAAYPDCVDELTAFLSHINPSEDGTPGLVDFIETTVYGVDCTTSLGGGTDAENDLAWHLLRNMYLGFKLQIKSSKMATLGNCNNSCIGSGEVDCATFSCIGTNIAGTITDLCEGGVNPYHDKESRVLQVSPTYSSDITVEELYEMMEEATAQIVSDCQLGCEESAESWLEQLGPCVDGILNSTERMALKQELISICQYGCDVSHPTGASSLPPLPQYYLDNPGEQPDGPPRPIRSSFVEALQFHLSTDVCDLDCNPYELAFPRPYGTEGYNGARPVNTLANSCICDQLSELESMFPNSNGYVVDTEDYLKDFSAYLENYSEVPLSSVDIELLKESCNSTEASLYLPRQMYLPPYLECDACVSCTELNALKALFEGESCSGTGEDLSELRAIYFNHELGLQRTAAEYDAFLSECGSVPYSYNMLCPQTFYDVVPEPSCMEELLEQAVVQANYAYEEQLEALKDQFIDDYYTYCLGNIEDRLTVLSSNNTEYHYTLYYYDQSGNLVQTIPPKGVKPLTSITEVRNVDHHRKGIFATPVFPAHDTHFATKYEYNSLGQMIREESPDMGEKRYWYDPLGRVFASQDERQVSKATGGNEVYSYTRYDDLGRIVEVGELYTAVGPGGITWGMAVDEVISGWIDGAADREDVTKTYYDESPYTIGAFGPLGQENLRSRVGVVTFTEVEGSPYDYASHYSYDAVGNVKKLVQEVVGLSEYGVENQYKVIEYDYDHISGKVNKVKYQEGSYDQFTHRYRYDADNRLKEVWTSEEEVDNDLSLLWNRDAAYKYYLHGPLARKELGHLNVQGMDYAYTLQGWIKALNSSMADSLREMGHDGDYAGRIAKRMLTATDAYSYTIGYFEGDYKHIGHLTSGTEIELNYMNSGFTAAAPSMYNGNIRHVVSHNRQLGPAWGHVYTYDQLHRLKSMYSWDNIDAVHYRWETDGAALPDYKVNNITYDPNGNILSLSRWGGEGENIDVLTYHYEMGIDPVSNQPVQVSNRLEYVSDAEPVAVDDEFVGQQAGNYIYDGSGNLIRNIEGDTWLTWTAYGKVNDINTSGPALRFGYGPDQNRWYRYELKDGGEETETYYIRDAQGNILSVYEENGNYLTGGEGLYLREHNLFGIERLGAYMPYEEYDVSAPVEDVKADYLGKKRYEITNHLGNVMAVISDRKEPQPSTSDPTYTPFYKPIFLGARDYYPFGMEMPGRAYIADETTTAENGEAKHIHRFGFNGKEQTKKDTWGGNTHYDYGFRIYNPAIGKFLSVDPLTKSYPMLTPYQFASNTPIQAIDLDGLEMYRVIFQDVGDNRIKLQITSSDRMRIVNYSEEEILPTRANKIAEGAANRMKIYNGVSRFNITLTRNPGTGEPIPATEFEVEASFKHTRSYDFTSNISSITDREGILLLVDDLGKYEEDTFGEVEAVGLAGSGDQRRVLRMEAKEFLGKSGVHTLLHEEGHREGLGHNHPEENIMSYNYSSYIVLDDQIQEIGDNLIIRVMSYMMKRSGFNRNNFIIRFSYGNPAEFDIQEDLESILDHGGSYTKPEK